MKKCEMRKNDKILEYLSGKENPYQLKVENMIVTMEYSNSNKTFNECISNIIKQKLK